MFAITSQHLASTKKFTSCAIKNNIRNKHGLSGNRRDSLTSGRHSNSELPNNFLIKTLATASPPKHYPVSGDVQQNCQLLLLPHTSPHSKQQEATQYKSKNLLYNQKSARTLYTLGSNKARIKTTETILTNMAKLISGKEVADMVRERLAKEVEALSVKPKLAIVQVGGREDSNVYIRMKIKYAESIGASAELFKLSKDTTEEEVIEQVERLNKDPAVHGIITQLPFDSTASINSDRVLERIDPKKDVDGLNIYNAGKLLHGNIDGDSFIPCTPNGCMELIRQSGVTIAGSNSVVLGRSKIVGAPMAQLLLWNNSTVTICHSRTKNVEKYCRDADILVVAVGIANLVKKSWIKPGAVVIDCGINSIPDPTRASGSRLVGDVDFAECKEVAGYITPVPGGVGPMTVAMLIANTVKSAHISQAKRG